MKRAKEKPCAVAEDNGQGKCKVDNLTNLKKDYSTEQKGNNPPPKIILRDYQVQVADDVISALETVRAVLMQAPCGAGKTVIAAELIRRYLDQHKQILFLAHRRELVFQCGDKLEKLGIEFAYLMAGEERSLIPDVTVASIQTLVARIARKRIEPPLADLIISDECHHIVSKTQLRIIDNYPNAKIIGLTATPIRGDGRGLGRVA